MITALIFIALSALPVQPAEQPIPKFNRAEWGRWLPVERSPAGCTWDTRHLVLRRDAAVAIAKEGRSGACLVVELTYVEPYTGETLRVPSRLVDIDHLVPLGEAHRSGGWAWPADRRMAYYNDLSGLVAASPRSNRSKSDRDPAEWMPTVDRCGYARAWIAIKARWQLSMDAAEIMALGKALGECR